MVHFGKQDVDVLKLPADEAESGGFLHEIGLDEEIRFNEYRGYIT